ncbi:MAG: cysteine--tRNA ligase, partial [Chthoniobacterales bacterium]|nr:cysteine--tRNA ligase [Chthoniobacterales bacterium]
GYSGREVRYALMRVHYRAPLNFTFEGMQEARQSLARIDDWVERLRARAAEREEENVERRTQNVERRTEDDRFASALDDDLNISAALAIVFDTIRETNRALDESSINPEAAREWLRWWEEIDQVLAISGESAGVPDDINALAEARAQARLAKEWRKSDELRDQLAALGWEVRDSKEGQKLTRRAGA